MTSSEAEQIRHVSTRSPSFEAREAAGDMHSVNSAHIKQLKVLFL